MENLNFHLNENKSPLFKELTINRLKKNNKLIISRLPNEDNNSVKIKTSAEKLKNIQNEKNMTNYKNPILKHIQISDNSENILRKNINKNNVYDLGDLINNLKSVKSYSINIKQKNNIITNINNNNNNINKNNNYNRNVQFNSIDKIIKKTIEKEKDYYNNDFQLSSKTFNCNNNINNNNNDFSSTDQLSNHINKIFKKHSHDKPRNLDNININNIINKFKQYKIINKNIHKNNININLNINNIQNIQNIETIDINKLNPNQKIFLIKNDIFNSYINCGKVYRDKNPKDKHFKTLQNYSHEKNKINYIYSTNTNTFRNSNNSSNIKNKLNSIRDNLFNNTNKERKNIKLNYNILSNNNNNNNQDSLPKFSSFETINNKNKRNENNIYVNNNLNNNYENSIDNKTINNETIKNKNINKKTYYKILSGKKKKFISFGEILKKDNLIVHNNLKNNNIILKLSKFKNNKIILPKNINSINNYNSNNNKPKNYFNHKINKIDKEKQNINNNYYNTIIAKNNNNSNRINLINSPQEQGLKLIIGKYKKYSGEIKEKTNNKKNNTNMNDNIYINEKPEYVKEYTDEILINLLIEEYTFNKKKKLIINTDILSNYSINPNIRSCLIDSLIGLQDTFKFCDKTLFITIKIFDNYISSIIDENDPNLKIEETDLDMIIVSCFLIASKMEESFIYHLTDYLSILSDKYNTNHLMNMEYNILKYYNFETFEPNTLDFFEIFISLYDLDESSKKRGTNILFAILLNLDLSQMPASVIAFSVIYLLVEKDFNLMMNKIDSLFYNLYKWSDMNQKNYNDKEKNEKYSIYMKLIAPLKKENDIKEILDMILFFVENIPKEEFFNIAKKLEQ